MGFFDERIFWIELLGENVLKLQKEIDERLKNFFEKEERFMSHITLVRIREINDKIGLEKFIRNLKYSRESSEIESFSLMKSELTAEDLKYEELLRIRLR